MGKKILLLGNSHLAIFGFRGEIIDRLVKEGNEVIISFPNGPFGDGEATSKKYGCKFVETPLNRRGKNPVQDIYLIAKYCSIIQKYKPDTILAFTVKCDIYGGIASRLLGVPFLPNITGLGKGLSEDGLTKFLTTFLYKIAIKKARCVFFQNESDKCFFESNHIRFSKFVILPGSGVNLSKFSVLPYPTSSSKVIFTYIARVMKAKGIDQFLEAAKVIKEKYSNTEFHICGYCEEDYTAIIQEAQNQNIVIYHGLVNDVEPYERMSSCIVLPSFHPEGISNVLLEAAACGRPIITTDRTGCRETVIHGVTGYLIKEKSSEDLIEKMEKFLDLSVEERQEMGLKGRKKMEAEFDRQIVVDKYLENL